MRSPSVTQPGIRLRDCLSCRSADGGLSRCNPDFSLEVELSGVAKLFGQVRLDAAEVKPPTYFAQFVSVLVEDVYQRSAGTGAATESEDDYRSRRSHRTRQRLGQRARAGE